MPEGFDGALEMHCRIPQGGMRSCIEQDPGEISGHCLGNDGAGQVPGRHQESIGSPEVLSHSGFEFPIDSVIACRHAGRGNIQTQAVEPLGRSANHSRMPGESEIIATSEIQQRTTTPLHAVVIKVLK